MRIEREIVGPLEVNCWIVSDGSGGPVVVIDPGDDDVLLLDTLGSRQVACVVLTHGHFDHLGAVASVVRGKKAPLAVHEADAPFLTDAQGTGGAMFGFDSHVAPPADRLLHAGDVIEAGALELRVLHTPGHTPGSICLLAQDPDGAPQLFSGDTLFAGSVGRTDFPRGDARALAHSIASELAPLSPDTQVHPGHGTDTTIGREARVNPFWPRA
jgi:glyoxylase-like metal-dependent hydrolase (beta-lactamase superfamily II)